MRALVLLVVVLAACGKKAEECRAYGTELGAQLTLAAEEPPPAFFVPDDVHLALFDDLPRAMLPRGLGIALSPSATRLGARPVDSSYDLRRALEDERQRLRAELDKWPERASYLDDPERAYFVIDLKTPWPAVVEAFETVRAAGITKLAFAFTATQTLKPPPRAPIDKALDAAMAKDPAERATELANILRQVIRECPAIDKAINDAMTKDGNHAMFVAKAIPDALVECECRVSKDNFRSAMFRMVYMQQPVRALQLATTGPVTRIELPATALWADAARLLRPTTKAVELIVAGSSGSAGAAAP
jgi:hypothetical protein